MTSTMEDSAAFALTAQQNQQRVEEVEQERLNADLRQHSKWEYRTREELEADSPSRRDGLDPVKEAQWRRQYLQIISKAGMKLNIPQWGIAGAALLCHRFFSKRSMKKSDRFIVATACLHLASKMEESPKPIKEVVKECEKVRHQKNPAQLKRLNDPVYLEEAKEQVLMAERAVLYTLGFDLNIMHPYTFLLKKLSDLDLLNSTTDPAYVHLMQNTWNFVNDSLRTTLCLQFPPQHIAYAALHLASHLNRAMNGKGIEDVIRVKAPAHSTEACFFTYFEISESMVTTICEQILSMYEEAKKDQDNPVKPSQGAMALRPPAPGQAGVKHEHMSPLPAGAVANGTGVKRKPEQGLNEGASKQFKQE